MTSPTIRAASRRRFLQYLAASPLFAGTGLAAFHHGLATSFKGNNRFRFMAGCTFTAHPGDIITYRVDSVANGDPVMAGIGSFEHK